MLSLLLLPFLLLLQVLRFWTILYHMMPQYIELHYIHIML